MSFRRFAIAALFLPFLAAAVNAADPKRDALWAAVRAGDVAAVRAAVDSGADVNARNEYGVTALWIAAGKDKLDVVEFLVGKGADVNSRDDIWYQTPLSTAVSARQLDVVRFLSETQSPKQRRGGVILSVGDRRNTMLAQGGKHKTKQAIERLIADYIAEIFHNELRPVNYTDAYERYFSFGVTSAVSSSSSSIETSPFSILKVARNRLPM